MSNVLERSQSKMHILSNLQERRPLFSMVVLAYSEEIMDCMFFLEKNGRRITYFLLGWSSCFTKSRDCWISSGFSLEA